MSAASRQPGEGQMGFDGSIVHVPSAVDPNRPRNALARTLTAEYMNLDPRDYTDVQPNMLEYVRPERLREHLINVPLDIEKSPKAVSYTDTRTHQERNIAVTDIEAKILPRFMSALQRNAEIGVGAKITSPLPSDADIARGKRARIHVQASKLPKVEDYLHMLETQHNLLDKFIVASSGRNVGLSMFGKEGSMREKFAYLQTFIIADMVKAYGAQRRLSESDMKMVEKAITVNIFMNPERIANFHNLVTFLREYNTHKQELAKQRIEAMRRNIGRAVVQP